MAVLAIGAIGAMAGASAWGVGIGLTASMGWNIGLTVGGMLFAPKGQNINQQGPRLGDLKVQSATYGNPIPIVYGSMRIAGNMIWSADIVETATTTTQSGGGKGGGGGSVTQTSYTYSQSFAVALCEGEIGAVLKIWANGKLIYNSSGTADLATIAASDKLAAGIRIYTGSETQTADSLIQASVGAADTPSYRGIAYIVFENLQLADYGNNTPNLEFEVSTEAGDANPVGARTDYAVGANPFDVAFDSVTNSVWVTNYTSNTVSKVNIYTGARTDYAVGAHPFGLAFDSVTNSVWVANYSSNTVSKVDIYTGARTDYATGAHPFGLAFDSVTNSVWVANYTPNTVSKVNIYTGARTDYPTGTNPYNVAFDSVTNSVWVTNWSSQTVSKVDIYTGARTDYPTGANPAGAAFDSVTNSVWVANWSSQTVSKFNIQPYGTIAIAPALSTIVSDICTRAGHTTGQIDVTALDDQVNGYVVQRSTARNQIEQLMQAFYFDAVESDGKIKFVKRGGSSIVSIPEDDLAAHEYGSAPPDTLITIRKQEMELPVECNVQYMDIGSAYQIGTQRTQRLTTESENKISINLAIAMTATKAKQIADVLMYDSWTGRTTFTQAHGWKYSYLEPTDIITVTKDGRSYVMRIVDEDASGGIYTRQAVLEDISVYSQTGVAAELPATIETVAAVPLTNLLLLDIPLLRDQDDGVGFYAAACGDGDGWHGAQVFRSNDGGATWGNFGNPILNAAVIGTALTALGDFAQNIFDESNTVTIEMINGELVSDTELNVLNGANMAILGNEIIQFRAATLVSAGRYTLTGLLRGRQGTEWARSAHAIGDRFVLLSGSAIYLFSGVVAEYDLERQYRGVSFGGFLDDATTINFTNTAAARKPYAPVHLGGGRNSAGDLTLNWIRRTRTSCGWNNYSDVPLGETSEAYIVEIYATSAYATIKRTISGLTSATTSYTAAQQTTDFGAPQAVVYWKAYQISAAVGNGYEARGIT